MNDSDRSAAEQQRMLRETAAARAPPAAAGGQQQQHPSQSAAPSVEPHDSSSFSELRRRLGEQLPSDALDPSHAFDPSHAHPPQQQQQHQSSAPPSDSPPPPSYARALHLAADQSDAVSRQSLEMPRMYDPDAELAARLQAEEDQAQGGPRQLDPAEAARRRQAEEADARMAAEMQQAEEAARQRARDDAEAATQLTARSLREREEAQAAAQRRANSVSVESDAELARRLQLEEESGHSDVASPLSHQSAASSRLSLNRHPSGSGDEESEDGVVLLRSDAAEAEREHRAALGLHHAPMQRQQSQRTREQIIRRLHQMQGNYPGLAGDQTASFRFNPDGRLVVGWGDEDEQEQQRGHAAASSSAASAGGGHDGGGGGDVLSEDDLEAQRAAFAQFEREQAARLARQQQQQRGGSSSSAASASASSSRAASDGSSDDGSESPAQPGLWSMLGSALHRHSNNSRQGVPFPLSLMLDPAQVQRARLGGGGGSMLSSSGGGGSGVHYSFSSGSAPGGGVFFRRVGGGGLGSSALFGRFPQRAEVDVENMDYEQLLQLEEALGSVKPKVKGADARQLEALPVREWHKPAPPAGSSQSAASAASSSGSAAPAAGNADNECSICLCEFEEGDAVKTLPCFHAFHSFEIDQWLRTNETCPVCRIPVSGTPVPASH